MTVTAVMQPTSNEVKREGFDEVRRSGRASAQQQRVLDVLRQLGPATRQQLADYSGLSLQTICPRCHELLALGLIDVVGTVGKPAKQVLALGRSKKDEPEVAKQ
ncbi:helix-turn-helix domain-containing protein [Halomonas korlensis]|uniref:Winged helix-turn-helix DNA-binding n=1 Tax=Halomonas korlensis TaxID=463301 RepID=A0A1I7JME9_9GAMM|nr:helix-turn-helix domain-containing protein [Halomonas korlensis]SFU86327.1 hypothetical protein SAMN04487955_11171 [Halomonas korlensis]